jgi:hypothetical protein
MDMSAYNEIYVSPCVSLHAELSRQPWLSEQERIAAAVEVAVTRAVDEVREEMVTQECYDEDVKDAHRKGAEELEEELRYIIETVGDPDDDDSTILKRVIAHLDKVRT